MLYNKIKNVLLLITVFCLFGFTDPPAQIDEPQKTVRSTLYPERVIIETFQSGENTYRTRIINLNNYYVYCHIDEFEFQVRPKKSSRWYPSGVDIVWGCD